MAEYIEKDAAIRALEKEPVFSDAWNTLREARDRIRGLPAADVVPVVHAKWIHYRCDMYECSACGRIHTSMDVEGCDAEYCPHCGAKMDGGKNHE